MGSLVMSFKERRRSFLDQDAFVREAAEGTFSSYI